MAKHTPTPWVRKPLGGSSMIVAASAPGHNLTSVPAIAYDEANGYSIGLPFVYDLHDRRDVRIDFVQYSHGDASFIVQAVNAHDELVSALETARRQVDLFARPDDAIAQTVLQVIDAALVKAKA